MTNTAKSQLARIHIAKKALNLDEDTYRDLLERVTGKRSSKNMSEKERDAVLTEMARLGWKDDSSASQAWRKKSEKPYVRRLYALAKSIGDTGYWRHPYKKALRLFVSEKTGLDNPEWLSADQATPLIEALKDIERRVT